MATVVLTFDDVGLGLPLQEALEAGGHDVSWAPSLASGPEGDSVFDLVVLAAGANAEAALDAAVERWQQMEPAPGILVVGADDGSAGRAEAAGAAFVVQTAPADELRRAADRAVALRFAGALSPPFARAALGIAPGDDAVAEACRVVERAREIDLDLIREALRRHVAQYVTATSLIASLREHRALEVPEIELTRILDGTRTLQTAVRSGVVDPARAGRLLWALACTGGVTLTPEPPDLTTPGRRAVAEARRHLRARRERLDASTYYDVLEVTPAASAAEVDRAARQLALRYGPDALGTLDLGDLAPLAEPMWKQVGKAHAVIHDIADRGRYNDWIASRRDRLRTTWAENVDRKRAEAAFAKGQRALVDGEVFAAVSAMAMACRTHPDHPDYEASLAWARHRAALQRDEDRAASARAERETAEAALAGRRPWPRGLVALGLLCVADGDAEAARWHLREALRCEPNLPAARRALQRLAR